MPPARSPVASLVASRPTGAIHAKLPVPPPKSGAELRCRCIRNTSPRHCRFSNRRTWPTGQQSCTSALCAAVRRTLLVDPALGTTPNRQEPSNGVSNSDPVHSHPRLMLASIASESQSSSRHLASAPPPLMVRKQSRRLVRHLVLVQQSKSPWKPYR